MQPKRMMPPSSFVLRLLAVAMLFQAFLLPLNAQEQEQAPSPQPAQEERDRGISDPEPMLVAGPEVLEEQRARINGIARRAEQLAERMRMAAEDDAALVEIRNVLEHLARQLMASGGAFRPRLAAINQRLDEIGPPRGEGERAEPPALAEERQSLLDEKAQINALLGEAETLSLNINRMIEEIAAMRRHLFTNTLSRRYDISAALSPVVLSDFAIEAEKVYGAISSWLRFVIDYKLPAVLFATFFALVAAGVLFAGGKRLFGAMIEPDPAISEPSYLNRLSVAFWSTLLPSASLAVFLAATYFFYSYYDLLRLDIAQMMMTLFNVIATVFFVYRLARAVFSPSVPSWRLVPVRTGAARLLFWLTVLTALVTGADFVASRINEVMGSPLSLTVAKSLLATIVVGVLVIAIGLIKPYQDEDGRPVGWNPFLRAIAVLLGSGTIIAALLGYIGLARFISQQIVVTGAILATMYIGHLSATAVSELGAFTRTSLGRKLDRRFQFEEAVEDQLGLVLSIVINVLVLAIGIPLILLQWGFQWGDIRAWTYSIANEVRIGSISISLIGILTGFLIFLLGFIITRGFQRWLDGKVMERGRVDAGVRNSISTAVGYAGIALAALIGISVAGIDLSNLALVAGALSLGIGFGLQNIVNNFVSGLILLAERPFKVGDWVVAGPISGTVKKISVRATEIETFQRQTVILPNSELINAAVGNWTHRNTLGRVDIPVGTGYDADPRIVHRILTEIVHEQPQVMKNPQPAVICTGFGDSSINFEIHAFLPDVTSQLDFLNEVRFRIVERFKEEGISIPFPQRDLHIKELPAAMQVAPVVAEKPAATRPRNVGREGANRGKRG